jgi:hypothetical protein
MLIETIGHRKHDLFQSLRARFRPKNRVRIFGFMLYAAIAPLFRRLIGDGPAAYNARS